MSVANLRCPNSIDMVVNNVLTANGVICDSIQCDDVVLDDLVVDELHAGTHNVICGDTDCKEMDVVGTISSSVATFDVGSGNATCGLLDCSGGVSSSRNIAVDDLVGINLTTSALASTDLHAGAIGTNLAGGGKNINSLGIITAGTATITNVNTNNYIATGMMGVNKTYVNMYSDNVGNTEIIGDGSFSSASRTCFSRKCFTTSLVFCTRKAPEGGTHNNGMIGMYTIDNTNFIIKQFLGGDTPDATGHNLVGSGDMPFGFLIINIV